MKINERLHAFIWRDPRANNCNSYFIDGPPRILIDPGHAHLFGNVESELARLQLTPQDLDVVLVTHAHPDHLEGLLRFRKPVLTAMGLIEYEFVKEMMIQAGWDVVGNGLEPGFLLQEGNLQLGGLHFRILLTPGHSPGSVCIYWEEGEALFSGDVVFNQGLGRTDLPGGDGEMLKLSIRRLAALNAALLLPGHGEVVTGPEAVRANFQSVEEDWFSFI
jgi:glyoxylase-like metal-dependent hydrolase (beta-lactamase superfamily II)